MKRIFLLCVLALAAGSLAAAPVSGRIFVDVNGDGVFDGGDRPLENLLVSDGIQWVRSDRDGVYRIEPKPGQRFVTIHLPSGYRTPRFYRPLTTETAGYDFPLREVPVRENVVFVQAADTESSDFSDWKEDFRLIGDRLDADFLYVSGDLCRFPAIADHAREVNAATMGRDVFYAVGNHDIVADQPDGSNYQDYLGPFWYSFERGNVLFVVAPMHYGDVKPPYRLADFGDYLAGLLAAVPADQPVFMLGHDVLDHGDSMIIPGNDGREVDLFRHRFLGWVFGHYHVNQVTGYSGSAGRAYTTAPPNKGGISHDPHAFRVIRVAAGGTVRSELRWSKIKHHLALAGGNGILAVAPDGGCALHAAAYDTADPIRAVKAVIRNADGQELAAVELTRRSEWSYAARLHLASVEPGSTITVELLGETGSGQPIRQVCDLTVARPVTAPAPGEWHNVLGSAEHNGYFPELRVGKLVPAWIADCTETLDRTSPVIADGRIFIGSTDAANGDDGRIYAFDARDGRLLWTFAVGYSIKGGLAYGAGRVFAADHLGHLYALDPASGRLLWRNVAPWRHGPNDSAVTFADGLVYGGDSSCFRAVDAETGETVWCNTAWQKRDLSFNGAPTVVGDTVVTGLQWSGLYGHDRKTGQLRWRLENREKNHNRQSATAVAADGEIFFKTAFHLFRIDPATGEERGDFQFKMDLQSSAQPVILPDLIITGSNRHGLLAVDRATGAVRWQFESSEPGLLATAPYSRNGNDFHGGLLAAGDRLFAGCSDGFLYVLALQDGRLLQKIELGSPVLGIPAVSGNALYVTDLAGRLFAFTFNLE